MSRAAEAGREAFAFAGNFGFLAFASAEGGSERPGVNKVNRPRNGWNVGQRGCLLACHQEEKPVLFALTLPSVERRSTAGTDAAMPQITLEHALPERPR